MADADSAADTKPRVNKPVKGKIHGGWKKQQMEMGKQTSQSAGIILRMSDEKKRLETGQHECFECRIDIFTSTRTHA